MNFVPIDSVASSASQIKDELPPQPFRRRALADSSAGRRPPPPRSTASRPIPVEIAFLSAHGVPEQVLQFAAATARRQGVCADEALLAEGLVCEDVFYRALAKHLNVDFIDSPVDVAASGVATAECGYARVRDPSSGYLWLFAPSGSGVFRLMSARRAARGRPLFAITTRTRFLEAVRRADPANVARNAALSSASIGIYARAAAFGADRWDCCSSRWSDWRRAFTRPSSFYALHRPCSSPARSFAACF